MKDIIVKSLVTKASHKRSDDNYSYNYFLKDVKKVKHQVIMNLIYESNKVIR